MLCGPKDPPPSFPSGVSLSEDVPACQGPDHKENPHSYWGPGKMSLGLSAAWATSQEEQTWEKCSPDVRIREKCQVCGWPSSCTHQIPYTSHPLAQAFPEGGPRGRHNHTLLILTLREGRTDNRIWTALLKWARRIRRNPYWADGRNL